MSLIIGEQNKATTPRVPRRGERITFWISSDNLPDAAQNTIALLSSQNILLVFYSLQLWSLKLLSFLLYSWLAAHHKSTRQSSQEVLHQLRCSAERAPGFHSASCQHFTWSHKAFHMPIQLHNINYTPCMSSQNSLAAILKQLWQNTGRSWVKKCLQYTFMKRKQNAEQRWKNLKVMKQKY